MNQQQQLQFKDMDKLSQRLEAEWNKFKDQFNKNNNPQCILFFGPPGSGKTTLFNWFFKNDLIEQMNTQHGTNYCYLDEDQKYMLIDFSNIINNNDIKDLLIQEEFISRLFERKPLHIFFVLKHLENDLEQRGTSLKQFCLKYQINKAKKKNFTLILNQYQDDLEEKALIKYVKSQQKPLIEFKSKIIIIKKIKKYEDNAEYIQNKKQEILCQSKENVNTIDLKIDQISLNDDLKQELFSLFYSQGIQKINKSHENFNYQIKEFSNQQIQDEQKKYLEEIEKLKDEELMNEYFFKNFSSLEKFFKSFENSINQTKILYKIKELAITSIQNRVKYCEVKLKNKSGQDQQQYQNQEGLDQVQQCTCKQI